MKLHDARVAGVVLSSQRDEAFIADLQNDISLILKLIGPRNYNRLRGFLPSFSSLWYYIFTSLSNLQTLGEEYTGTIRTSGDVVPKFTTQLLWLVLYVGGESLFERALNYAEVKVSKSTDLRREARDKCLKYIKFLKNNRSLLIRIHHSLFYIHGIYPNISNRITSIRYVLVRQWLANDSANNSFRVLGIVSMIYLMFQLFNNYKTSNDSKIYNSVSVSGKTCVLCVSNRKNTCSTPCGHLFCWECIFDCMKYQQSCPVCREAFKPSRITLLQNYS